MSIRMQVYICVFLFFFSQVSQVSQAWAEDFDGIQVITPEELRASIVESNPDLQITDELFKKIVRMLNSPEELKPSAYYEPTIPHNRWTGHFLDEPLSFDLKRQGFGAHFYSSGTRLALINNVNIYDFDFAIQVDEKFIVIPDFITAKYDLGGIISLSKGLSYNVIYLFASPEMTLSDLHGKTFGGRNENNTSFSLGIKSPIGGGVGLDLYSTPELVKEFGSQTKTIVTETSKRAWEEESFKVIGEELSNRLPEMGKALFNVASRNTFILLRGLVGVELPSEKFSPTMEFRVSEVFSPWTIENDEYRAVISKRNSKSFGVDVFAKEGEEEENEASDRVLKLEDESDGEICYKSRSAFNWTLRFCVQKKAPYDCRLELHGYRSEKEIQGSCRPLVATL